MFIDANDSDTLEPCRVVDQDPLALGHDGVVSGVPGNPETLGDPGDGEVSDHDPLKCPPQPATRELRPRVGRPGGVLAPHVPAASASVAADGEQQRGRSPAEWFVGQLPGDRVPRGSFAAASAAPLVGFGDPARDDRTVGLEALAGDDEAELVESAEGGQIWVGERA